MWSKFSANNHENKQGETSDAMRTSSGNGYRIDGGDRADRNDDFQVRSNSMGLTDDLVSCASSSMLMDFNDSLDPSIFNIEDIVFGGENNLPKTEKKVGTTSTSTTTIMTTIIRTTTTTLVPTNNRNINPRKKLRTSQADSRNQINNGGKSVTTNSDIDEISEQMGKLWFPSSVQEFTQKHERDKYGRLRPMTEERATKCGRALSPTDGSSSSSIHSEGLHYSEWYDAAISTVHAATTNMFGTFREKDDVDGDIKGYEQTDQKLRTSMYLTKTIDKVWAKELYELDAKERETITDEIHGIESNRAVEETDQSVKEAIKSFRSFLETNLDQELDNRDSIVPPVTKEHYRRGLYELKSGYIISKNFLIKFLRICFYNFEDAALRYFRYLDLLHLLFGDEALTRPLELTDLTKREIRYLRKGQMQLLPSRDRVGRRIFAFSGCDDWHFNIREKYRVNVYLIDVLSDDVTSQKLGSVSLNAPRVRYDLGDNPFAFEGMTLRVGKQELLGGKCTEAQFFRKINEAVPIRFTAIHYFAPPTMIYNIGRAIILSLLGKEHRKIVRFHAGSQLECNYSLRSFGIPPEDVTITDGGNIKTRNIQKFVNARRTIETFRKRQREQLQNKPGNETELECPGIECPEVNCIIFGDKAMNNLKANLEFRELVRIMERQREESVQSVGNVLPIKQFIESIIAKARSPEYNLRFVVFDKKSSLFIDLGDHSELWKRVSQAYRDQRKRSKQANASRLSDSRPKSPPRPEARVTSSACLLEEPGTSIMGLEAAKRLKRSYEGNPITNYLFCTDLNAKSSGENNGSIII